MLSTCCMRRERVLLYLPMLKSTNRVVFQIAKRCLFQCRSNMGKNGYLFSKCLDVITVNTADVHKISMKVLSMFKPATVMNINDVNNENLAMTCQELMDIRDGLCTSPLTTTECAQLVEFLCII